MNEKEVVKDKDEWRTIKDEEEWYEFDIFSSELIYINGSSRAFVLPSVAVIDKWRDVCTICLSVQKAWSFDAYDNGDGWADISKKYGVDIRLYGFESGMQFGQEMVVENGKIVSFKTMEYDDYEWECPFPYLGG